MSVRGKVGGRKGGREGGREGGRKGEREREKERKRKEERERKREGKREGWGKKGKGTSRQKWKAMDEQRKALLKLGNWSETFTTVTLQKCKTREEKNFICYHLTFHDGFCYLLKCDFLL